MSKETERQIAAMKKLGYSDAQIEEMLEDDKAVDRNEPLPWDMSKEEHKKAMRYANVDEHKKPPATEKKAPTVYNWSTDNKERKGNATKEQIVAAVAQFMRDSELGCNGVEITNKQGKIAFVCGENSFTFTLTQHRKK